VAIAPKLKAQQQFNDYHHVIMISVDGLRSDALQAFSPEQIPALSSLLTGAYTLNARTDPQRTVTLPNHVGMLTGLHYSGSRGHNWIKNHKVPDAETLHSVRGKFTPGVFHVAAPNNVQTAVIAAKDKFQLFPLSWNSLGEIPVIDTYSFQEVADQGASELVDFLLQARSKRSLSFWHLREMDVAGHTEGWNLQSDSLYMKSLLKIEHAVNLLLTSLRENPAIAKHTAILLTSDHGGGVPERNHWGQGLHPENWTIPFMAWSGRGEFIGDIYHLNAHALQDPGSKMGEEQDLPALSNAHLANLALAILGLESIPNSQVGAQQNIRLTP